jgi:hypothetical protein
VAIDSIEDCYEELRDWREHARRNPLSRSAEPQGSRCDIRRLKRSLRTFTEVGGGGDDDESWRHA